MSTQCQCSRASSQEHTFKLGRSTCEFWNHLLLAAGLGNFFSLLVSPSLQCRAYYLPKWMLWKWNRIHQQTHEKNYSTDVYQMFLKLFLKECIVTEKLKERWPRHISLVLEHLWNEDVPNLPLTLWHLWTQGVPNSQQHLTRAQSRHKLWSAGHSQHLGELGHTLGRYVIISIQYCVLLEMQRLNLPAI